MNQSINESIKSVSIKSINQSTNKSTTHPHHQPTKQNQTARPTFPAAAALSTHSFRTAVGRGMYTTATSGIASTRSYPSTAWGAFG
jgi:hypothetical protein